MLFADRDRTVGYNKRRSGGIRDGRELLKIEVLFVIEVMIGLGDFMG